MVSRSLVVVLALAVAHAPDHASAKRRDDHVVMPAKRKGTRAAKPVDPDLSRGGTRRGGIEYALGAFTAILSAVLVGRGTWELVQSSRIARLCASGDTSDPTCVNDKIPGRAGKVAGGLSLAFAVPAAVASGFLFRRAVRIQRDYRKFKAHTADVALTPWADTRSAGVGLRLRF